MLPKLMRRFAWSCLAVPGFALTSAAPLLAQVPESEEATPVPAETVPAQGEPVEPSDPSALRPLNQPDALLSFSTAERLLAEAAQAAESEEYDAAIDKLSQARRIFNQLSNFHQQLAASFQGIDVRISEEQRRQALQTAQKRDESTYQLALVHRAKQEAELAVPLLIQVIRSQNPTSPLGAKAYQQLFELGFVESEFPTGGERVPVAPES